MAEFKVIALDKIVVPERLREVEEDHAFMIGQSIARIGLLNPITVRATPRAARPYTLVAGAHRIRGAELAGLKEIEAAVVKADKAAAQMAEIEENVFRNELSALDRAVFVARYRELWEEQHGRIGPGGDTRDREDHSVSLTEWSEDSARGQFFLRVSERMGLSRSAVERAQRIGLQLLPDLRQRLRGTAAADNQSLLLKLVGLGPERQTRIATAMAEGHDLDRAIELTDENLAARERLPMTEKRKATVITNYASLGEQHRRAALREIFEQFPGDLEWALEQLRTAKAQGGGYREP